MCIYIILNKSHLYLISALDKACSVILSENHSVDILTFTLGADKTAVLHATMSSYDEQTGLIVDSFTVNILPCFTVDNLPTSLKLAAPLPCFGPYIEGQKIFRQLVRNDVEEGNHVVLLTPKVIIYRSSTRLKTLKNMQPVYTLISQCIHI